MNPLDLPGPWFLLLYVVAFGGALVLRRHLRRMCSAGVRLPDRLPKLSPYEVACVVGGRERVMETVLAKLARDGTIAAATQRGRFTVQASLQPGSLPLVGEARDHIQAGWDNMHGLCARASSSLQALETRLQQESVLLAPDSREARCYRRASTWPLWALLAFGTAKLVMGASRGKPVALLAVLLVITFITLLFSRGVPRLSALGAQLVPALTRRNSALGTTVRRRARELSEADLLLAVALFGSTALSAGPLSWLHQSLSAPHVNATNGSSGGGGTCSSGGSSCSSGGGSGCGGCGGGGGGCGS
nr:TIGR04222 domain-containing membrane protein [uncultured Caldimonas sp.]